MDLAVWLRSLGLEQYEATFRGEIKLTAVELHPTHRALAVHKFECANCGPVTTKILYRKLSVVAS